ncbi:MAG: S-layer homology domain-containing protein [Leptolyngbya sp. SIO1E4]|nr:S-layer homology domain-containing protein [Leptolyngbya sp. SIO1E4]
MFSFASWRSSSVALASFGILTGAAAPLVYIVPAAAQQTSFSDVSASYWARPFIERLAEEDIIAGFPDGSFKPDQPVTRAQFAAIIQKAFNQPTTNAARTFPDVASDYWAQNAIQNAYRMGFLSGYPDGRFQPEQAIPRVQVLVSLANGLEFTASGSVSSILDTYRDDGEIPEYALGPVAAATQEKMVVNYPNIDLLNPNRVATRADVAAFVYQAMVAQDRLPQVAAGSTANSYIVGYSGQPTQASSLSINSGTVLDMRYPSTAGDSVDIVVAPGQTVVLALEVANPITNGSGQTLIPAGSTVQGRIVPVNIQGADINAAKFVAEQLTVGNRSYRIQAESDPVAASSSVDSDNLEGALVTAAAQSILGDLLGNRSLGNIVGGVLTGSDNTTSQNAVIVIDPNQLDLQVETAFEVEAVQ